MGIAWKDMARVEPRAGQPVDARHRLGRARLAEMTPAGHEAVIHVTLTDDHPWAQAFVVISRLLAHPWARPGQASAGLRRARSTVMKIHHAAALGKAMTLLYVNTTAGPATKSHVQ